MALDGSLIIIITGDIFLNDKTIGQLLNAGKASHLDIADILFRKIMIPMLDALSLRHIIRGNSEFKSFSPEYAEDLLRVAKNVYLKLSLIQSASDEAMQKPKKTHFREECVELKPFYDSGSQFLGEQMAVAGLTLKFTEAAIAGKNLASYYDDDSTYVPEFITATLNKEFSSRKETALEIATSLKCGEDAKSIRPSP